MVVFSTMCSMFRSRELPYDGAVMMMWKLLLQSRQRRQKTSVAKLTWKCVVNDRPVGNPKRRFDEYSSKFSLSYETKAVNPVGKNQYD
jgi:hypothetical protein